MNTVSEKICLCKAVQTEIVKESIRTGARTIEGVASKTGAGTGACKGSRCKMAIYELIKAYEKGEWQ
ncbi:MAG: (2Fe-2S)-binding protein [Zhenhengia sp.]|jgi:bacterioferritin-associated ferredoxin|uniref:(2Fe-2S)-binding protein n=1 Tax=Zhenhengia sp. TaxID=2944208 RepID=UPI002911E5CC|nr:(2Fe-2S)-binding protein [Clostridiales bacterium]MDU6974186.1 (2Fe-2S)-binding protein [Clostridiales bacterium]